jgi:hypothetical protein
MPSLNSDRASQFELMHGAGQCAGLRGQRAFGHLGGYASRVAPLQRRHPSLNVTSSLCLAGDWLLPAGFRPGDRATGEVGEGQLTITKA